jgi:hypothetical protein
MVYRFDLLLTKSRFEQIRPTASVRDHDHPTVRPGFAALYSAQPKIPTRGNYVADIGTVVVARDRSMLAGDPLRRDHLAILAIPSDHGAQPVEVAKRHRHKVKLCH